MGRNWVVVCVVTVVSLYLGSYFSDARPADGETDSFTAWYAKRQSENWTGTGESKSRVAVLKPLASQGAQQESGEIVAIINPDLKESTIMKVDSKGNQKEMGTIDTASLNPDDGEEGPDGRYLINLDWSILDFSKNRHAKTVQAPPPPPRALALPWSISSTWILTTTSLLLENPKSDSPKNEGF
ncbi:CLAVATA3/ESR (CLE)-related protein 4 [Orchesella cincta]|uniref:CLAVATA3/ESR (CLE)-related protein 4 n=1 Tax=Orchesella cincta TaxID=48709 RepID=A0A1D2NKA5_ORCCI|nr:CLAVATA3/ESR (CLE)-related protein 4 [Orchesella cincta]